MEREIEIGRILQLKFETRNLKMDWPKGGSSHSEISSFEFELQDSSNFKISLEHLFRQHWRSFS